MGILCFFTNSSMIYCRDGRGNVRRAQAGSDAREENHNEVVYLSQNAFLEQFGGIYTTSM